jgi:hypothetical protein
MNIFFCEREDLWILCVSKFEMLKRSRTMYHAKVSYSFYRLHQVLEFCMGISRLSVHMLYRHVVVLLDACKGFLHLQTSAGGWKREGVSCETESYDATIVTIVTGILQHFLRLTAFVLKRLVAGFQPRQPGLDYRSDHVGFVAEKVARR